MYPNRQIAADFPETTAMLRPAPTGLSRREFLIVTCAASVVLAAGIPTFGEEKRGEIPYRPLGKTGEKVSAIGVGGFHIGVPKDEQEGIRIIRTAIDKGINFLDNSWDYHDGGSEGRMGKALADGYRANAFLITKICDRTKG